MKPVGAFISIRMEIIFSLAGSVRTRLSHLQLRRFLLVLGCPLNSIISWGLFRGSVLLFIYLAWLIALRYRKSLHSQFFSAMKLHDLNFSWKYFSLLLLNHRDNLGHWWNILTYPSDLISSLKVFLSSWHGLRL